MQIQLRMQFSKLVLLILGTLSAKNDNDVNSEKDDVTASVSFKKTMSDISPERQWKTNTDAEQISFATQL